MILLVTYDLKKPGKDYTSLYNLLKTAPHWWHYMESVWIIQTTETVDMWNTKIAAVIDQNDLVLIVDITKRPRQGRLIKEAWDWIRTNENL
ncbi:MAG: hypothetical protein WC069_07260 [Candidatus Shapirobacteria bacterium]